MPQCIYCSANLHNERGEHIFLEALGGKRASREIVCTKCNNYSSQAIDKYLPEELAAVRMLLDVNPSTFIKLREKDSEAELIFYHDGQRKRLLKVDKQLLEREPGLRKLAMEVEGDPQQVAAMVQGLINKYGEESRPNRAIAAGV